MYFEMIVKVPESAPKLVHDAADNFCTTLDLIDVLEKTQLTDIPAMQMCVGEYASLLDYAKEAARVVFRDRILPVFTEATGCSEISVEVQNCYL